VRLFFSLKARKRGRRNGGESTGPKENQGAEEAIARKKAAHGRLPVISEMRIRGHGQLAGKRKENKKNRGQRKQQPGTKRGRRRAIHAPCTEVNKRHETRKNDADQGTQNNSSQTTGRVKVVRREKRGARASRVDESKKSRSKAVDAKEDHTEEFAAPLRGERPEGPKTSKDQKEARRSAQRGNGFFRKASGKGKYF